MVVCAGEILADMIGKVNGTDVAYVRKAGGAPFNVACGIKKFGASSAFVGSVGDDIIGRYLASLARDGVDEAIINLDPVHNTTLAFVQLDGKGERSFCFYRKDTADFHMPSVPVGMIERANIVHIGSLMLSEAQGIEYARNLACAAKKAGKLVSFDVNYREDIFPDKSAAIKAYRSILELADIVKLSEEELPIFGQACTADKLVCITLGANGSEWRYRGAGNRLKTIPVKPVDTTGAGDAFYAGVLAKLDCLTREEWTEEKLNATLRFANVCGALSTLGHGAIDALPSLRDVERALQQNK